MIAEIVTALLLAQSAYGGAFPASGTPIGAKDATSKMRPVLVDSSGSISTTPPVNLTGTGTITATQSVEVVTQGAGNARAVISGTWSGTLYFEGTVDGTQWNTMTGLPVPVQIGGAAYATSTAANGTWEFRAAGYVKMRVRGAVATGSAVVTISAGAGTDFVAANIVGVNSIVSSGNSVTCAASGPTCLGVGGVFTGTSIDTSGFAQVSMSASSDVISACSTSRSSAFERMISPASDTT